MFYSDPTTLQWTGWGQARDRGQSAASDGALSVSLSHGSVLHSSATRRERAKVRVGRRDRYVRSGWGGRVNIATRGRSRRHDITSNIGAPTTTTWRHTRTEQFSVKKSSALSKDSSIVAVCMIITSYGCVKINTSRHNTHSSSTPWVPSWDEQQNQDQYR